jgi:hypothetical protein
MLAGALLKQFSGTPWQPLPVLGLLGLATALRRPDRGIGIGWGILIAYSVVLCGVYISAPQDLGWLIATSLSRVFPVLGPATLFLALVSVLPHQHDDHSAGGSTSDGDGAASPSIASAPPTGPGSGE